MDKIIYVIVKGRNGNQLFQYGFARRIQEMIGGELVLDFSEMGFNKSAGKYGPEKHMDNALDYFNVMPYTYVDVGSNYKGSLFHRIQLLLYRFVRKLYTTYPGKADLITKLTSGLLQRLGIYYQYGTNSFLGFRKPSKSIRNVLIRGWFESESYFEPIKDLLKEELKLSAPVSKSLADIRNRLLNEDSVCVHVRRGDFASKEYKDEFLICDLDYYKKGVSIIEERHPTPLLFVCSDDIQWCRECLFKDATNIIYEPSGLTIAETMLLMTSCHHFVISNSTLSFWMQYLSSNQDKMVVAPSVWRRCNPPVKDIFMKDWILVNCK